MTPEEKRKKLETLPWQALFDASIQKDVEAAKLNGKDKSEIIELLIHQAMISNSEVDGLVNDYIYGNRITFTLWTFPDALGEEDYAKVQALEGTTEAYLRADGFRGLRILSVKDCGDRLPAQFASTDCPFRMSGVGFGLKFLFVQGCQVTHIFSVHFQAVGVMQQSI